MNDLLEELEAAIAETERIALAANHNGRWFTYGDDGPDEGRLYVLNGEDRNDGWAIAEFTMYEDGWANALGNPRHIPRLTSMQIRHIANVVHAAHNDPIRVLRRVVRDRKLLELHHGEVMEVWNSTSGESVREEWFVCAECGNGCVHMWPCDTVRTLAEDYEIEVSSES